MRGPGPAMVKIRSGGGEWLKKVVRNCPKEIATVGVGIQSNAVSRYYPNHVVIQNPNELPDKMIPIMRPMLMVQ